MIVVTLAVTFALILVVVIAPILLVVSLPLWIFDFDTLTHHYFSNSPSLTRGLLKVVGFALSSTGLWLLWAFVFVDLTRDWAR